MKLADLPDGYPVAVDTETSGTQTDAGSRIAVVSFAFRVPDANGDSDPSQPMVARAIPFDQGVHNLPMGAKVLDDRTALRLSKWPEWAQREDAGNRSPAQFVHLTRQLRRLNLIWHNGKFDMNHFRKGLRGNPVIGVDLERQHYWDTMLTQRILNARNENEVDLKGTAVRKRLGASIGVREGMEDDEKIALKPWLGPQTFPRYDLVPWSVMEPYAGMDAKLTLLLAEHQWEELDPERGGRHFELRHIRREFELCKVLYRMEGRGLGWDVRLGREMTELLEKEKARLAAELPFEPTPVRARKFFFGSPEDGGLGHVVFSDKLTEKKQEPQVDDEVVARLVKEDWEGQEVAKQYQRHEGVKSAISKWYEAWTRMAGPDQRLRTNFKQADVVSGRLAVGYIQLQAIPHAYQLPKVEGLVGVRDLFVEDKVCSCCAQPMELWEFDISQAEIRIATAMAKCKPMLDGFARGDDSHSIATRLMFADLFREDGYEGREEEHPLWEELRQVAKRCNLGILYGAGGRTIQEQILKFTGRLYPLGQVREWIDQWNAAFPEMSRRLNQLERFALDNGWVKLRNGRQRWFARYEHPHKAFNQEIQGSLAETMKEVMILVENAIPDSMLLQIHDSLVMRLCPRRVEEQKATVIGIMSGTYERTFAQSWGKRRGWVVVPFISEAKRFGRKPDWSRP